ncbi:glycosyltransferase [Rufibacter tibetensis]|uniref:glycosyltransferase n=1 Tax=Rufibacter tibetensis TaxID=512763 RepID=UPI000780344B|nr:glycosyltransferase [Rufibacter tibetensis]
MIPKIFHYCWFGGQELPEEYQDYINGWKSFHPDWELKKWDETNSPMELPYIMNAQRLGNYANISNLVRFYALKEFGGIYLDTDIKVIKSLEGLLSSECFLGFESNNTETGEYWLNNAVLGSVPNHKFVNQCINELQRQFDGSEKANLSAPVLVTNVLKEAWGLQDYGCQILNGIHLYPVEFFYPIRGFESYKAKMDVTDEILYPNAYTIHCWGRAWYSREMFVKDIEVLQEYTSDLVKQNAQLQEEYNSKEFNFKAEISSLENENENLKQSLLSKESALNASEIMLAQQVQTYTSILEEKEMLIDKLVKDISYYQNVVHDYQKQYDQKSAWEIIVHKYKSKNKR